MAMTGYEDGKRYENERGNQATSPPTILLE
jgi:hypothetical protein